MTIEADLKSLVRFYAVFDHETKSYRADLSPEKFLSLERSFGQLLLKSLLIDGPEKAQIEEHYKKLTLIFDQKNKHGLTPELIWIDKVLSRGKKDFCLATLFICYQKLTVPENFKNITFKEIVTREDLKKWLENFRKQSITSTERTLYDGLIHLLDESSGYFDEMGKIKQSGIKFLLSLFPMIVISMGTAVFVEELFVVYVFFLIVLKSGQLFGASSSAELKSVGTALQKMSTVSAMTTTILLVRLTEMVFWSSLQCYSATLEAGSAALVPFISSTSVDLKEHISLEEELIMASKSTQKGIHFIHPELKLIAAPIESRLALLGEQYFIGFRAGKVKFAALDSFLRFMRELDENKESLETKLDSISCLLTRLKKNKAIYTIGSKTAFSIDKAESFLVFLKANPMPLDDKEPLVIKGTEPLTSGLVAAYF